MLDPDNPNSYFELLSVDPKLLPPEQRKIQAALYGCLADLNSAEESALGTLQKVPDDLFGPLMKVSSRAGLPALRSCCDQLRESGQQRLDKITKSQSTLVQNLKSLGIDEALASTISSIAVAKTTGVTNKTTWTFSGSSIIPALSSIFWTKPGTIGPTRGIPGLFSRP